MIESRRMLLLTPFLCSAVSYSLTHAVVFVRFGGVIYFLCRLDSQFDSTEGQGFFYFCRNAPPVGPTLLSSGVKWPECGTDH